MLPDPNTASPAVVASALANHYGAARAVDDISFTVGRGRVTALLGGNGAGKTTTMCMLLGLLLPTAGSIRVLGEDMTRHRYRVLPRLNFSAPYVDLPHRLTVEENLRIYAGLYGIRHPGERMQALAADLDLIDLLRRAVGSLSAGQKTRVALAKALINQPELLLLDEPTASLDRRPAVSVVDYLPINGPRGNRTTFSPRNTMAKAEPFCARWLMRKAAR